MAPAAGLAAIILLWLVYPRQYDLGKARGPRSQNWTSWDAPNASIAGGILTGEIAGG